MGFLLVCLRIFMHKCMKTPRGISPPLNSYSNTLYDTRQNPSLQDSPPAAGCFSNIIPLRRSAILPGGIFYITGKCGALSCDMKKAHGVVTACLPFTSCNWLPYYSSGPIALRHTLSGILPKLSIKRQFSCNDLLYHIVTKKQLLLLVFCNYFFSIFQKSLLQ